MCFTCGVRLLSTNQQLSRELPSLQVEPVERVKRRQKKKYEWEFSTFPVNTIPLCFYPWLLNCTKWWITSTEGWLLFKIKYKWTLKFKRELCYILANQCQLFYLFGTFKSAEFFNKSCAWVSRRDIHVTQTTWKMQRGITSGARATAPAPAGQSRCSSRPRRRWWLLLTR